MGNAEVKEVKLSIPTYGTGKPQKAPMFFEKRVYQGSSGKVYPNAVIEKIYDDKKMVAYDAVVIENDFIEVVVLPELGGRIYYAVDKTNCQLLSFSAGALKKEKSTVIMQSGTDATSWK